MSKYLKSYGVNEIERGMKEWEELWHGRNQIPKDLEQQVEKSVFYHIAYVVCGITEF